MQRVFDETNFDQQTLRCDECKWQGKGFEAVVIDLYGVVKDKDVHCPTCDAKLGTLKTTGHTPGESASDLSFQLG